MANRKGKNGSRDRFYFRGLWTVTAAMELKDACSSPFLTWPWWQGGWQNPWSTLPPSQARGSLGQPYVLSAHCSQEETGWWSAMRLGWSLSCPHHCPAFQGPMAEQPCPGGGGPGVPMLAVGLASEHLWQGARNVGMDPGTCVLRRVFSQAIKKQKLVSIMMNWSVNPKTPLLACGLRRERVRMPTCTSPSPPTYHGLCAEVRGPGPGKKSNKKDTCSLEGKPWQT